MLERDQVDQRQSIMRGYNQKIRFIGDDLNPIHFRIDSGGIAVTTFDSTSGQIILRASNR